jgi:hypothetical protein
LAWLVPCRLLPITNRHNSYEGAPTLLRYYLIDDRPGSIFVLFYDLPTKRTFFLKDKADTLSRDFFWLSSRFTAETHPLIFTVRECMSVCPFFAAPVAALLAGRYEVLCLVVTLVFPLRARPRSIFPSYDGSIRHVSSNPLASAPTYLSNFPLPLSPLPSPPPADCKAAAGPRKAAVTRRDAAAAVP